MNVLFLKYVCRVVCVKLLGFAVLNAFIADNHLAHDGCHQRLGFVGSLLHLFMAYLDGHVEAAEVGNDADAEGADAAMMSHDYFGNSAHADGVATEAAIHLIFGRSLEGGTLNAYIYAVVDTDVFVTGNVGCQLYQIAAVGLVHVGESGTGGEVLSAQRMLGEEVDVVGDYHQVANLKAGVHTSCGIADEECFYAELIHHPDRECNFFHRVALIKVEASLHGHDVDASEFPED